MEAEIGAAELRVITVGQARELIYGPEDPAIAGGIFCAMGLLTLGFGILILVRAAKGS